MSNTNNNILSKLMTQIQPNNIWITKNTNELVVLQFYPFEKVINLYLCLVKKR